MVKLNYKGSFVEVDDSDIKEKDDTLDITNDSLENDLEETQVIKMVNDEDLLEQTLTDIWGQNDK